MKIKGCFAFITFIFFAQSLNAKITCDQIIVKKKDHTMTLFLRETRPPKKDSNGKLIPQPDKIWTKIYRVALGAVPGKKAIEGDKKTPEGDYRIKSKNSCSSCHKSLMLNYPNDQDKAQAKKLKKNAGNYICIHGLRKDVKKLGKNHIKKDWTHGCIGVTDHEIDEIFAWVQIGTPIKIVPAVLPK